MTVEADRPDPTASMLAFFGSEVLRLRTKAGWSQEKTAHEARSTHAMISYVENAKRVPSKELADGLDVAFRTDGHFGRLHPLVMRYAYPKWFVRYVELEQEATRIRSFQAQMIPGLLQTEDYARALFEAVRPDNLDGLVAARMTRQTLLEHGLRCWFIVDEPALDRLIGGEAVMRDQLKRLLAAGQEPRIVIQVIPRTVPAHAGLTGPFTLLSFDEGADVLHVDGFSQGRTTADTSEVDEAVHAYDLLRAVALSPKDSADLIRTHLKELGP
ncbi:helix-turn-helix transcriptional regulator [Streptomyces sp. UNOC14_S4]|uniref:helix-turn-helix domain-containing protein n=1 Tax=Streptomyces sp. UNOC14_S4 TaxID=2872340 RepID=UPI001E41E021|nr:helix-turn-helix transcriptional regulator [Streptomyces sp. UNOC14_S4]MCC3768386.1 helix-turn-helix transcriptional regulator [Streptomyces sp. UNOC14_S4]